VRSGDATTLGYPFREHYNPEDVKGYHERSFSVNVEQHFMRKKKEDQGPALKGLDENGRFSFVSGYYLNEFEIAK